MREKERKIRQTDKHIMYIKYKSAMYILLLIIIEMNIGFLGTIVANIYATYSK